MIKEIENFNRNELFNHYHSFDNPFFICTTRIDITNLVNYCKIHKNFYATFGFIITMSANQIDAFKYRFKYVFFSVDVHYEKQKRKMLTNMDFSYNKKKNWTNKRSHNSR